MGTYSHSHLFIFPQSNYSYEIATKTTVSRNDVINKSIISGIPLRPTNANSHCEGKRAALPSIKLVSFSPLPVFFPCHFGQRAIEYNIKQIQYTYPQIIPEQSLRGSVLCDCGNLFLSLRAKRGNLFLLYRVASIDSLFLDSISRLRSFQNDKVIRSPTRQRQHAAPAFLNKKNKSLVIANKTLIGKRRLPILPAVNRKYFRR